MKTKKEELEAELTRLNALRKQVEEKLKALPVYELNRWHKHPNGSLYFIKNECEDGHLYGYGFDNDGDWSVRNNDNYRFCAFNSVAKKEIILASAEQVEKALIEEAKRRYKVGDVVISSKTKLEIKIESDYFEASENYVSMGVPCVFLNGQWATIIEQDKFAELKEAHRSGAVIQYYSNSQEEWEDVVCNDPLWNINVEYRIKPEENPKVGDVVKAWNSNSLAKPVIGKLEDLHLNTHYGVGGHWYENARALTKQEAIDLLFNRGAN